MSERKMRRRIEAIPGTEWRSQCARESFQQLGDKLLDYGVPHQVAADILTDAYEAAEEDLMYMLYPREAS